MALSMAGWIRYLGGKDELGEAIDYQDNMAPKLIPLAEQAMSDGNVKPFMQEAFGDRLGQSEMYCDLVSAHLMNIKAKGVKQAI